MWGEVMIPTYILRWHGLYWCTGKAFKPNHLLFYNGLSNVALWVGNYIKSNQSLNQPITIHTSTHPSIIKATSQSISQLFTFWMRHSNKTFLMNICVQSKTDIKIEKRKKMIPHFSFANLFYFLHHSTFSWLCCEIQSPRAFRSVACRQTKLFFGVVEPSSVALEASFTNMDYL